MLTEKLKRWQNLQREADRLARETEVLRLLQTVEVDVDDAVIARFTVPRTDWRRVVEWMKRVSRTMSEGSSTRRGSLMSREIEMSEAHIYERGTKSK